MRYPFCALLVSVLALATNGARAEFHTFQIEEIYSNSDGSVQYLVMHEAAGMDGENFWSGHSLTTTNSGGTKSLVFPNDLPGGSCGYYGCTSAMTANRRVLIATQGFASLGLVTPDFVVPNGFFAIDGATVNYAGVDQITYAALPIDGVNALNRSGAVQPNTATNFAGKSASVAGVPAANFEGLWWKSPAGSESGWGVNLAHQGDVIFATWFTYDVTGKEWWLSMTANKQPDGSFAGTLFQTSGPAFDAVPFSPTQVSSTSVGTATLTFGDSNNGTFAYTVNGVSQAKAITRQVFGALPSCEFGAQPNLALATNYQDLWWNAPAGSESGWGVNLTQQGDVIFATWFTYDHDHTPLWLSATAGKTAPGTYTGTLYRTTGPAFNAVPFDPTKVMLTAVGSATLTFTDGDTGTFAYTVNGETQTKSIVRQVFRTPGTVCR